MTGYINYLELPLDPRLQALLTAWQSMRDGDLLPRYDGTLPPAFADASDYLCITEIRPGPKRPRYYFVSDGAATAAELGFDLTGRYLDELTDLPEFQTMLESDFDTVRTSGKPRSYAEEHHLDGLLRRIIGIQLPFATDGTTVDHILEVTYRIDQPAG